MMKTFFMATYVVVAVTVLVSILDCLVDVLLEVKDISGWIRAIVVGAAFLAVLELCFELWEGIFKPKGEQYESSWRNSNSSGTDICTSDC